MSAALWASPESMAPAVPGAGSVPQPRAQARDLLLREPDLRKIGTHSARALEECQHVVGAFLRAAQREGEPVKSIWTGFKVKNADLKDISTYRCRRCGYLESYA